jgi:hypothetical protein
MGTGRNGPAVNATSQASAASAIAAGIHRDTPRLYERLPLVARQRATLAVRAER